MTVFALKINPYLQDMVIRSRWIFEPNILEFYFWIGIKENKWFILIEFRYNVYSRMHGKMVPGSIKWMLTFFIQNNYWIIALDLRLNGKHWSPSLIFQISDSMWVCSQTIHQLFSIRDLYDNCAIFSILEPRKKQICSSDQN